LKKKILGILLAAMLILPFTAGTVSATCSGHPYVEFFTDINYRGTSLTWCVDTANRTEQSPNLGVYGWNDRISSYKTVNFGGELLRIYSEVNYGGSHYLTTTNSSNVPDVGVYWRGIWADGFNDVASSFKIYPY